MFLSHSTIDPHIQCGRDAGRAQQQTAVRSHTCSSAWPGKTHIIGGSRALLLCCMGQSTHLIAWGTARICMGTAHIRALSRPAGCWRTKACSIPTSAYLPARTRMARRIQTAERSIMFTAHMLLMSGDAAGCCRSVAADAGCYCCRLLMLL